MHAVSSPSAEEIREGLATLAAGERLRLIYACESGSRAWGFPSVDSDHDVRFIYVRPLSWYLAVELRRDVVDDRVEGELDFGGWDVRKCFRLLRGGNAPLLEWLASPIVYLEDAPALERLRSLVVPSFRPRAACHHYLAQVRRFVPELCVGAPVRLKSACYALRAMLAATFVVDRLAPPPMALPALLAAVPPSEPVQRAIDELVARKRGGREGDAMSLDPVLGTYLSRELVAVSERIPFERPKLPRETLDAAFRETLRRVGELPRGVSEDR